MNAVIRNVLLVFAALLPIVNPFGMAPIFAEMTLGYSVKIRRTVAMRVAVNGAVLLVASLFVGSYILQFFGVSLAAVQFGGGLVVTVAGWRILNRQDDLKDRQLDSQPSDDRILSQAFYPLTMPLTVGPGSIAVALTLGSNLHEEGHLQLIVSALAAVIGILLIGADHLLVLSLFGRIGASVGTDRHKHPHSLVGFHPGLHWHSDHVQRPGRFLSLPPYQPEVAPAFVE